MLGLSDTHGWTSDGPSYVCVVGPDDRSYRLGRRVVSLGPHVEVGQQMIGPSDIHGWPTYGPNYVRGSGECGPCDVCVVGPGAESGSVAE